MYKVYINKRVIFLSENSEIFSTQKYGLFFKYNNASGLSELVFSFINSADTSTLAIYHDDIGELWEEFRKLFLVIEAAGGLVCDHERRILSIKRFGKWDLPKGKKTEEEKPESCALREVSEECGINKLKIKKSLGVTYHIYFINNKPVLKETNWFEMFHDGTDLLIPQTEEDITEARWFNPDEVSVIIKNTYPSIIYILEKAGVITR